jgi:hypothetical protein
MEKAKQDIAREISDKGFAVIPAFLSGTDVSSDLLGHLKTASKFFDGVIN